jgi:hypothetical protein
MLLEANKLALFVEAEKIMDILEVWEKSDRSPPLEFIVRFDTEFKFNVFDEFILILQRE